MRRDRGGAVLRLSTCEWCGNPMYKSRSHARFCSNRCRTAYCRYMKYQRAPMWVVDREELRQMSFKLNGVQI